MSPARNVLVLGGTSWLGGEVARQAVARGDRVTCLARGASGAVPDGAGHVVADRWQPDAYNAVAATDWDLVVDVSWQPALVRSALTALAGRAAHWVYVSSVSVYADFATPGLDESATLVDPLPEPPAAEVSPDDYAAAKVSCETGCVEALGADRVLLVRAGLIVGPGDRTDRFGYWPARLAGREGPILAPARRSPLQVIDVRDLAAWLLVAATRGEAGPVDAVGRRLWFGDLLDACGLALGAPQRVRDDVVEAPDEWLVEQQVTPWMGPESLPLWLPRDQYAGMMDRSGERARSLGLITRPLPITAADSLAWERRLGLDRDRRAGLSRSREVELLGALLSTPGRRPR